MTNPRGPRTGRPPTLAPDGMVTTPHALASAAGLRILQSGGSAVDAAIAANAVLCVVYPHMAGLGGDGFWLIHDRARGVQALDAGGPAAASATTAYYRERGHDRIPERGALAALTVPGAVDGWRAAHERYGRLEWRELFTDAIRHAERGLPVSRSLAGILVQKAPVLREHQLAARTFLPDGRVSREGERLLPHGLARSLERIAQHGARAAFYEGELAAEICAALGPHGSPLSPQDFAAYRAEWVRPISARYRDRTVYEFPPSTQGFAALQILNLLEGFDVAAWGDGSADYYHHAAEAVKVAFADRDEWLTDPRFVDIPVEHLISKGYADERRRLIDPEWALVMQDVPPGVPFDPARRERRAPGGDTCAFSAADRDGLTVSVIQSIYQDFGSAAIGGSTGILLQNRGSFFSLDPRQANCLEPGKRTFHTLIPAMLFRGGELEVAFGTMGGEGQPQTHAALVTRLVDFGYDVQQAIEAPRWLMGRTWGAQSRDLSLEGRIPDEVARELRRRGQPVRRLDDWDEQMGHAQAIRLNRHGFFEGGADPRGDGAALGY